VHGGAGNIPTHYNPERQLEGMKEALNIAKSILDSDGSALDAVEAAVKSLEDNPVFNAGKGAVFTEDSTHELEASIMNGEDLRCGAVAGLKTVKNPISLARLVMEESPHILLGFEASERFAKKFPDKIELVENSYFTTEERTKQLKSKLENKDEEEGTENPADIDDQMGTVGAVAMDSSGNLAAAASTGGRSHKMAGRIGDTPVIGAGIYANNNTCAVSGSGNGEQFLRHCVAANISHGLEIGSLTLEESVNRVIERILDPDDGGVIAVDKNGNIVTKMNTLGMYRGVADSTGVFTCEVW